MSVDYSNGGLFKYVMLVDYSNKFMLVGHSNKLYSNKLCKWIIKISYVSGLFK